MTDRARVFAGLLGVVLLGGGLLAGCAAGHGKYTSAFREQAQANMDRVKSGTTWDMARQRYLAGDLEKALRGVDESIALTPDVAKAHLLRGRVLMEMGRGEEALESLVRAGELDGEDAAPAYFRGLVYERWGRFEVALSAFEEASAKDESDPQYVLVQAETLMELGRLEEARVLLGVARSRFEHNAGVRQTLGHLAMMRGDVTDAVEQFEAACLLAPEEEGLVEDLARALIASGRFAEAEYALSRVLGVGDEGGERADGERRDLRHLRARVLLELDRPVEAREEFERLVRGRRGGTDVDAWLGLGGAAVMIGDELLASRAGTRVTELAPDRAEGWVLRAAAMREAGRTAEALALARRGLSRDPGSSVAGSLVASLERAQGAIANVEVSPDG